MIRRAAMVTTPSYFPILYQPGKLVTPCKINTLNCPLLYQITHFWLQNFLQRHRLRHYIVCEINSTCIISCYLIDFTHIHLCHIRHLQTRPKSKSLVFCLKISQDIDVGGDDDGEDGHLSIGQKERSTERSARLLWKAATCHCHQHHHHQQWHPHHHQQQRYPHQHLHRHHNS